MEEQSASLKRPWLRYEELADGWTALTRNEAKGSPFKSRLLGGAYMYKEAFRPQVDSIDWGVMSLCCLSRSHPSRFYRLLWCHHHQ